MNWVMGYRDADLNIEKGTQNQVLGVSSKDDESKTRGKRAVFTQGVGPGKDLHRVRSGQGRIRTSEGVAGRFTV